MTFDICRSLFGQGMILLGFNKEHTSTPSFLAYVCAKSAIFCWKAQSFKYKYYLKFNYLYYLYENEKGENKLLNFIFQGIRLRMQSLKYI